MRCTGRAPADYFPSPARLGSDLRASAIQAALQPVDRPLLGACALLLSVTGKYDYSKFGRRSQAKFAAGMVKPWRRAGKSRPGQPDGSAGMVTGGRARRRRCIQPERFLLFPTSMTNESWLVAIDGKYSIPMFNKVSDHHFYTLCIFSKLVIFFS